MLASQLVLDNEAARAFHFAGGLHHAMPERASGFCYVNDAVLAIMELRRRDWKVAYVDIDAHHGDGVQFAFYDDPRVLTISSHERGDRLFPGTGFVEEMGEGEGVGYSVNLPLQPYTDDAVYEPAFEAVVPPLLRAFEPDVVVLQLGIDSHRTDPLTHLAWTVQGFTKIVSRLLELSPRVVALGGGGYDLPNVARAWTAAWAAMNGAELAAEIPRACHKDLAAHGLKSMKLWDPPLELPAGHAAVGGGVRHAPGQGDPRAHLPDPRPLGRSVARFNIALRDPGSPGGRLPMRIVKAAPIAVAVGAIVFIWLLGSSNPLTPAGYVGYVTQGARVRSHALLRAPDRPDLAGQDVASVGDQRQRDAVHLPRGLRRARRPCCRGTTSRSASACTSCGRSAPTASRSSSRSSAR